ATTVAEADRLLAEAVEDVAARRKEANEERERLLTLAEDEAQRLRSEGRRALSDGLAQAERERDRLLRDLEDEITRRRAQIDQELTAESRRVLEEAETSAEATRTSAEDHAASLIAEAEE